MRVLVAALEPDSVAHRALTAEGVEHTEHVVGDGYGELLADYWTEGFVVVEHDVAPWTGAIAQLAECGRDWCMFRYPKQGELTRGLGCTKFSDRLVRAHPDLPDSWRGTDWRDLDGAVGTAVRSATGSQPCFHGPPVAHARRAD